MAGDEVNVDAIEFDAPTDVTVAVFDKTVALATPVLTVTRNFTTAVPVRAPKLPPTAAVAPRPMLATMRGGPVR